MLLTNGSAGQEPTQCFIHLSQQNLSSFTQTWPTSSKSFEGFGSWVQFLGHTHAYVAQHSSFEFDLIITLSRSHSGIGDTGHVAGSQEHAVSEQQGPLSMISLTMPGSLQTGFSGHLFVPFPWHSTIQSSQHHPNDFLLIATWPGLRLVGSVVFLQVDGHSHS